MASELRGVIDSIEGDWAVIVLDDDRRIEAPRSQLPEHARVGDAVVVRVDQAGDLDTTSARMAIEVDAEDTAARKARVKSILNDIFKKK
jgi:hypothetical protein